MINSPHCYGYFNTELTIFFQLNCYQTIMKYIINILLNILSLSNLFDNIAQHTHTKFNVILDNIAKSGGGFVIPFYLPFFIKKLIQSAS